MQLWPGATSGPKVAQRGLAPLLWGQGVGGATAHVKGPQSPWRAEATGALGQGTQGSHLLPMGHVEGAGKSCSNTSRRQRWPGTRWVPGRAAPVPAPRPGPRSPVLLMPTQPAAQLHPLIRAGRKFRFPWAERKEGMLRGNVKSLPSSCFHCLTLTTVHRPFPASPSSPQHASSSEDPSEGRLAEDPAGTVQPCCQMVQGCSRAAGLPWKAPARACTFCRGCISHARPGTRSPGRPWGWGREPEEETAERSEPGPARSR